MQQGKFSSKMCVCASQTKKVKGEAEKSEKIIFPLRDWTFFSNWIIWESVFNQLFLLRNRIGYFTLDLSGHRWTVLHERHWSAKLTIYVGGLTRRTKFWWWRQWLFRRILMFFNRWRKRSGDIGGFTRNGSRFFCQILRIFCGTIWASFLFNRSTTRKLNRKG